MTAVPAPTAAPARKKNVLGIVVLLVFAVLLTRGGEVPERALFSPGWHWGVTIGAAVFALLAWAIRQSPAAHPPPAAPVQVTVEQIGTALMTHDVLALEVTGLLLTAALIGAVIIAMNDGGPQ
ncbi:MAG TPA: NADH-quinone oxidoreductase subunit J [Verrucomicrobiota bacterium]|nr:NADH-quinone oxidoreductase subunit J [Verrucomicrobiota bacterium]